MSKEPVSGPSAEGAGVGSLERVRAGAERAVILGALRTTHGRRADAARILGISRKTLWKKLKQLGIAPADVTTR
jgi:DNA-binding NtrC family response regulator